MAMIAPAIPKSHFLFSYDEITKIATAQIKLYMDASRRASGAEARDRRERAYGVYMGWRALVETHPDREKFVTDDARLEAMQR